MWFKNNRVCRYLVVVYAVLAAAGVRLVSLRVHSEQSDLYDPVENFLLVRSRRDRSRSHPAVLRHGHRLSPHLPQGTQHSITLHLSALSGTQAHSLPFYRRHKAKFPLISISRGFVVQRAAGQAARQNSVFAVIGPPMAKILA